MGISTRGRRRITFRLDAPEAREVSIGGDFNRWEPQKHMFSKNPSGVWEKTLMLDPGRYEYKFMVDGMWCMDPLCPGSCDNAFGSRNSVIEVESRLPDKGKKPQLVLP
ncbi:MAG: glycogen-binding domain-containing protein [Desulfobacterales bacterium]